MLLKSMQKVKEISLPHYQSMSSSNEYAPVCNKKMINIDLNEFWHSHLAKNKNSNQVLYRKTSGSDTKYHTACSPIPHTPCPRTKFMQVKKWHLTHNKTHAEYFYSITVVW